MTTIATSIEAVSGECTRYNARVLRRCGRRVPCVQLLLECYKTKDILIIHEIKAEIPLYRMEHLPGIAGDAGAQYSPQSPGMSISFTHCHFSRTSPSSLAFLETRQMKYYRIIYLTLCWAVPSCNAMQGRPVARSEQAPSTRLVPKNRLIY